MNSLFEEKSHIRFPEGFTYIPEFISETEELLLLQAIGDIPLHPFLFQGFEAKRKVASFGYDYHFDKRAIDRGKAIPAVFEPLMDKVSEVISIMPSLFEELLVTEYPVGAVINWHRDAPPFDLIAGISLASDCTFRLRPQTEEKRSKRSVLSFPVRRRSLYVMHGPARTDWQHSITPVTQTRYSITLRTLRK